jgi:hypothetical protein
MVDEEMPLDTVPAGDSKAPALTGAKCVRAGSKFDDMSRT